MSPEAVFALATAAIAEHGDEMAFENILWRINSLLEAGSLDEAQAWTAAAAMVHDMLDGPPH